MEPGETPSYSASQQAPNYAQGSLIYQNILKRFRFGCGYFFNLRMFSTVRSLCMYQSTINMFVDEGDMSFRICPCNSITFASSFSMNINVALSPFSGESIFISKSLANK